MPTLLTWCSCDQYPRLQRNGTEKRSTMKAINQLTVKPRKADYTQCLFLLHMWWEMVDGVHCSDSSNSNTVFLKITFIVHGWWWCCLLHSVWEKPQLSRVLLPWRSWGLNLGCWAWMQVPSLPEPSCRPLDTELMFLANHGTNGNWDLKSWLPRFGYLEKPAALGLMQALETCEMKYVLYVFRDGTEANAE